jgi:periplasmic protein TonB
VNRTSLLPWMAIALLAHGAAYAASDRPLPTPAPPLTPLEVELAPPMEPRPIEPDSMPVPEEVPIGRLPSAPAPPKAAPRPSAASAPSVAVAAKVGALLTSGETADNADPVAFFSDPNGAAYGSGVVAPGGKTMRGVGPTVAAAVSAPPPSRPPLAGLTPAADLSRAPSLEEPDACRGFFPAEAMADSAKVDLVVIVQSSGRVTGATLVRESPEGEGFGPAARACLLSKRFSPGVDRAGREVAASAAVRVHFTR